MTKYWTYGDISWPIYELIKKKFFFLSIDVEATRIMQAAKTYEEGLLKKITLQGLRWHGFKGFSQIFREGFSSLSILGISNRKQLFWHFNYLDLDTLHLSGKIRTRQFKTPTQPLLCFKHTWVEYANPAPFLKRAQLNFIEFLQLNVQVLQDV